MKIFIASLTIFAMFFGAGNLIYPIFVGILSLDHFAYGILGFIVTGALIPLLGLFGVSLYEGDIDKFFGVLGRSTSFSLIVIILLVIGPLIAIPRCTLVAFSGIKLIIPGLGITTFNIIFCFLITALVARKSNVVDIIGRWLTPFLVIGVFIVILAGIFRYSVIDVSSISSLKVFQLSMIEGYSTMDLLASFFFAKIIISYLSDAFHERKVVIGSSILTCTLGVLLLSFIYSAIIYISAKHPLLPGIEKPDLLIELSRSLLGNFALPIASLNIMMACTTTAIGLTALVSDWFSERFNIDRRIVLLAVVSTSFISAMFGFEAITVLLVNILSYLYPSLIVLTLSNILTFYYNRFSKLTVPLFWGSLIVNVLLFV